MKPKRHASINELVRIAQLCSNQSSLRLVLALALVISSCPL